MLLLLKYIQSQIEYVLNSENFWPAFEQNQNQKRNTQHCRVKCFIISPIPKLMTILSSYRIFAIFLFNWTIYSISHSSFFYSIVMIWAKVRYVETYICKVNFSQSEIQAHLNCLSVKKHRKTHMCIDLQPWRPRLVLFHRCHMVNRVHRPNLLCTSLVCISHMIHWT